MSKGKQTKGFIIGAVVGGVIGAVSALLFAPKAGKELRQDIAEGAHKAGDAAVRTATLAYDKTERFVKQIGEGAAQLVDKTKLAADAAVSSVKSWGNKEEEANEQAAKAAETVSAGETEAASGKETQ